MTSLALPEGRLSFQGPLQTAWDSTSLRALEECPRKYQYSILLGFSQRAESVHLTFGIHYHKGLEWFDHRKAEGHSHDEAVLLMVRKMMELTWGWKSDDTAKNRFTLIRSLVWYVEKFRDDPAETIILKSGKPAVELSFRFSLEISTPTGEPFQYSGHLDRLARYMGGLYVLDRKTSKNPLGNFYFEKFNPDIQMSGYTLGGKIAYAEEVRGVVIDATQVAVGFNRYARGVTLRTPDQLDEWLDTTNYHIKMAESYAKAEYWPMNRTACGNFGGCPFQPVCSRTPKQRDAWLKSDYTRRIWDPLVTRGDI